MFQFALLTMIAYPSDINVPRKQASKIDATSNGVSLGGYQCGSRDVHKNDELTQMFSKAATSKSVIVFHGFWRSPYLLGRNPVIGRKLQPSTWTILSPHPSSPSASRVDSNIFRPFP
jgi:hypothetical protein